jgi:hypothetical protein
MSMQDIWVQRFPWPGEAGHLTALPAGAQVWRSVEGDWGCSYLADAPPTEDAGWTPLLCHLVLQGAAAGSAVGCHYVVETDVLPEHESEFNAWYDQEHLPGLAGVPGTVRAARYVRHTGSPRYYACYDLESLDVLGCDAWLAVRATAWSSRVRPLFRNTRRTMYRRVPPWSEGAR